MGNKKRKLGSEVKIPKISYGLSRSIIEQQRNINSLGPDLSPKNSSVDGGTVEKNVKKPKTPKIQNNVVTPTSLPSCPQSHLLSHSNPTEQNSPSESFPVDQPIDSFQFSYGTNQVGILLQTTHSKVMHISGMCSLKLIAGKGNINGYRLKTDEEITIHSPPWMPAVRLFFESAMNSSQENQTSKKVLNQLLTSREYLRPHKQILQNQFLCSSSSSSSLAIIEIISVDMNLQNWMIRCEDYSKYQQPPPPSPSSTPSFSPSVNYLSTAIIGSSSDLTHLGFESQILPTDWVTAGDLVCKSIKSSPRTMLIGAKGVGK
jgi:hypothetical protein